MVASGVVVGGGDGILREFGKAMYTVTHCYIQNRSPTRTYSLLCASLDGRGLGREWIQVSVWLSPFTVQDHNMVKQL